MHLFGIHLQEPWTYLTILIYDTVPWKNKYPQNILDILLVNYKICAADYTLTVCSDSKIVCKYLLIKQFQM